MHNFCPKITDPFGYILEVKYHEALKFSDEKKFLEQWFSNCQ